MSCEAAVRSELHSYHMTLAEYGVAPGGALAPLLMRLKACHPATKYESLILLLGMDGVLKTPKCMPPGHQERVGELVGELHVLLLF